MKQLLVFLSFAFFLSSCADSQQCEHVVDVSKVTPDVKILRLEKSLFQAKSPEDIQKVLISDPQIARKYYGLIVQDTQELAQGLYGFYTNPQAIEFYKHGENDNKFSTLEPQVIDLFKHIKYYYPEYKSPLFATVVTGLIREDIYMDDSLIVVSMDYFYGKKAKYRPNEYEYMLQRRNPENLVPSVAQKLAMDQFVEFDPKDKTLLAEMIKWGKMHYFMDRVFPCTPDSILIGWKAEQVADVEKHLDVIWDYFIKNELFYITEKHEIQRYVGESPKVAVIGEKCPGRIGRYIGWQIVKEYMERNPKVSLKDLMNEKDAQKIFKLSKYKPKVK